LQPGNEKLNMLLGLPDLKKRTKVGRKIRAHSGKWRANLTFAFMNP